MIWKLLIGIGIIAIIILIPVLIALHYHYGWFETREQKENKHWRTKYYSPYRK